MYEVDPLIAAKIMPDLFNRAFAAESWGSMNNFGSGFRVPPPPWYQGSGFDAAFAQEGGGASEGYGSNIDPRIDHAMRTAESRSALAAWLQAAATNDRTDKAIRNLVKDNPKLKPLLKDAKSRAAFAHWVTAVSANQQAGLQDEMSGRGGLFGTGRPWGGTPDAAAMYRAAAGVDSGDAPNRYIDARSAEMMFPPPPPPTRTYGSGNTRRY